MDITTMKETVLLVLRVGGSRLQRTYTARTRSNREDCHTCKSCARSACCWRVRPITGCLVTVSVGDR